MPAADRRRRRRPGTRQVSRATEAGCSRHLRHAEGRSKDLKDGQRFERVGLRATSSRTELFTYTPAGRVSGYDDGDGTLTSTWDADGNRLRYTRPAAPGRTAVDERAVYHPDDSLASSASTDDTGAPTPARPAGHHGFGGLKDDGCTSYGCL